MIRKIEAYNKGARNRLLKSVNVANVRSHERILDLGCGDMILKTLLPDTISYIGIDINGEKIKCNLEKGLPHKIANQKFDVVFMNEFIEHIENFKSLLIQCKEVLSENGRIVISTPSNNRIIFGEEPTHIHCFRKSNMYNLARICGLKIEKITGTYIRLTPFWRVFVIIPTNQTIYTEVLIYKMVHNNETNNR